MSWRAQPEPDGSRADLLPDIILEAISQLNFNDTGEKHYLLNATQATHFTKQGITEFQKPDLVFYEQNQHNWDASADSGITRDNGDSFHLHGNVVIRKLDTDSTQIVLKTDSMHVSPKTEIAETDDDVDIVQGNNRTRSKGLRVDMQTGKLTLQSKVNSRYNPPASS